MKNDSFKQETIEEEANNFADKFLNNGENSEFEAQAALLGFIDGAKCQAKRMFTLKQVEEAMRLARAKHHNYTDMYTKEQIIEKLNTK